MDVEQRAIEGEEDVFFADLKDRISLLIMEDEDSEDFPVLKWPCNSFQPFSYTSSTQLFHAPPRFMYDYEASYRREVAKGTGVFIPALSFLPRRKKNRSGRARQSSRSRKPGVSDPPSPDTSADKLSSCHAPSTCTSNADLTRKHRHQLSTKKKGMAMC